jgi:hypothetical protein
MPKNRLFFPEDALNMWVVDGKVELNQRELVLPSEGRRYRLIEAAHVLRELTGMEDPYELVHRVKSLGYLNELGAEILETSMLIGENAYDIVPGFLGSPIGSFEDHIKKKEGQPLPDQHQPATDEEMLGQMLLKML